MGNTTDAAPKASLDFHTEVPLSELALPPEQRTPEAIAQYAKALGIESPAGTAPVAPATPPAGPEVTYDQFKAVEIVVGRVIAAKPVPKADKLVHMVVDLGAPRNTVDVLAGILKSFPDPSVLLGKTFAFVANLPPRPMKGIVSKGMLLCAVQGEKVIPVEVPGAEPGARLS